MDNCSGKQTRHNNSECKYSNELFDPAKSQCLLNQLVTTKGPFALIDSNKVDS